MLILTLRDYLLSYLNFSISIISRAVEVRLYFIVLNIISCFHLIPYLFELNFRERHFIFRISFIFKVSDLRSKIQCTMFKKRSYNKVFYETFNFCSMMFIGKFLISKIINMNILKEVYTCLAKCQYVVTYLHWSYGIC